MKSDVLVVPEVHCDHCVSSIESAVGALEGVESVEVNLERKDVTVTYDEGRLELDGVAAAIEEQGYDVAPR